MVLHLCSYMLGQGKHNFHLCNFLPHVLFYPGYILLLILTLDILQLFHKRVILAKCLPTRCRVDEMFSSLSWFHKPLQLQLLWRDFLHYTGKHIYSRGLMNELGASPYIYMDDWYVSTWRHTIDHNIFCKPFPSILRKIRWNL